MRRRGRDPAGEILPGYTDLQEIGGGAFATVFRATESETGRPVALKVLKVDTIHAHLLETFQREIHALAAVSDHPNIVTLYRPSTTSDGRPVLVLELCRLSLAQQLRESGPLSATDVTRVGIKIAGALETAHRNGFLHRDMKPQNILVTTFGEPALADFGVAALQASAQATAGVFGFNTLHAAPEMLEGHHLSPATDVYGLASTMYQLLTGQAPFASFENESPASVILRILRDPVRPLRAEHIPLQLADLLEAALSKEPEGRPRAASDFARLLQGVEAKEGWLPTSFVAWGEDGPSEEGGPSGAEPARGAAPELGPMGVRLSGPPGSVGSGAAVGRTSGRESRLPPLLPPSGLPSVAVPEPAARQVVAPSDAVRGRFGEQIPPAAAASLVAHPVDPEPGSPAEDRRPTFVDPEPAVSCEPAPPPRMDPAVVTGPEAAAGEQDGHRRFSTWALVSFGVAIAVVMAAVLVIAAVV